MSNLTVSFLLLFDGLACMLLAAGAHALGLDPNPDWGVSRYALFFFGLGLLVLSVSLIAKKNAGGFIGTILNSESVKTISVLAHLWGIILLIYIWFITFGTFTSWTHTSHYYTLLADAFAHGQLHVDMNPGSLLDAADPYDPGGRAPFRDEIWDMSFYDGKLYFYWGPVPSLLLAPIQSLTGIKASDSQLVFWFLAGLLVFNSLIVLTLWRRFFPMVPAWNVFLCIALIGLILPIPWEAGTPYVYAVAATAGPFFLMGGIYFILQAFDSADAFRTRYLFLAGFFWACAVGSRAILAIPVIFMAFLALLWILKSPPVWSEWKRVISPLLALFVPLAVGAALTGWYNWARFDSPLEFGIRYQITTYNLNERAGEMFRFEYAWRNLYAYLIQPFRFVPVFPFIEPIVLSGNAIRVGAGVDSIYYAGRTVGLLFSMPFLFLGLIPVFSRRAIRREDTRPLRAITLLLAASGLTGFLSLLFYFNAQTRFIMDFVSPFTLLAIPGYWMTASARANLPSRTVRAGMWLSTMLLAFTILAGLLLSITGETSRMESFNPNLLNGIDSLFR